MAHDSLVILPVGATLQAGQEVIMDVETCAHPACSCAVTDREFCSTHCEEASKDVAAHDTCECGHSDCSD